MFKNDTMTQYVSDRAPSLAPRAPRRADWTIAAIATEARRAAIVAMARPSAPVVDLRTRRVGQNPFAAVLA